AGSVLALDLLEDGLARRQPNFLRVLTRIALRLLDLPPTDDHDRLAAVYHADAEHIYRDELDALLARTSLDDRLGAWRTITAMADLGHKWILRYADDRWPEDADQMAHVLKHLPRRGTWLAHKLVEVFPLLDPVRVILDGVMRRWDLASFPDWIRCVVNAD